MKTVKCIRATGTGGRLVEGDVYQVVVDVRQGVDYKGRECAGYILQHLTFPYVWDYDRFVDHVEPEAPAIDETLDQSSLMAASATDEPRDTEVENGHAAPENVE